MIQKVYKKIHIFKLKRRFKFFGSNSIIGKLDRDIIGPEAISIGNNVCIEDYCRLACYTSFFNFKHNNAYISIGDYTYINRRFTCLSAGVLKIGTNVLIASDVFITNYNHDIKNPEKTYYEKDIISKDVIIGDNVWIGEKTIILPGVVIGKNSIIGAGSVVTKSIPDYSIAVGNPAKVIKTYSFETKEWSKNMRGTYD